MPEGRGAEVGPRHVPYEPRENACRHRGPGFGLPRNSVRGGRAMGRGRAKAKQTKVARELKYHSPNTDLAALQRELSSNGKSSDEFVDQALGEHRVRRLGDPVPVAR